MKSREEFLAEFSDRTRGLLLRAFAETEKYRGDTANLGRAMFLQMQAAQSLLGDAYTFIAQADPPAPPATKAVAQTQPHGNKRT